MPGSRRRPTAAERAELVAGYQAGETVRQLALRFGFHRETVSIALKRAGVERRYHDRGEVDLDRADELHSTGLTITAVAARLGIGRTTLVKALRARSQAT